MLDTYANLKASVLSWMQKEGLSGSDALAADFIALAEAEMRREIDAPGEVSTYEEAEIDAEGWTLPCQTADLRSVVYSGAPLPYIAPDQIGQVIANEPVAYTIDGQTLRIASTGTVTVRLSTLFAPLSTSVRCNWLLRDHPDAYLNGALRQAAIYFRDDERLAAFSGLFSAAIDSINRRQVRQQFGGQLRIQSGVTP